MTQPTSHPPVEDLAAYAADDLDSGAVDAHVAGCAECAADVAAIQLATRGLAELPDLRMPLDVITSLEAALAAARVAESAPEAPASLTDARSRRAGSSRFLPFAAAAAVVALATTIGVTALRDSSGDDADTAATRGGNATVAEAAAEPRLLHSGTDYSPGVLDFQVRDALAAPAEDATAFALQDAAPAAPAAGASAPQRSAGKAAPEMTPEQLQSCVDELSGTSGVAPLVVDFATFDKQPAVVVVLPFRDDKVDVFVVRPTCRLNNAELILFKRVAAPR